MGSLDALLLARKSLDEICAVPDKIISVYSLEKHIWADSNSVEARRLRKAEKKTVEEFQISPVRHFLNDILRNMAAPYKPERKENPIGQGYWIQAEFGSGKSHLLCFLAALALGDAEIWEIIKNKEVAHGLGKRESIYRFWEEGLRNKSTGKNKGIFVIARTLVGSGGGAVGISDKGKRLSEYILESIKEQLLLETGKNLSLYPAEILADRFINQDLDRYRKDLKKFLKDPNYFAEDAFEDIDDFIKAIQQNKSPQYKQSCGNKLWRFYTEYLKVHPQVPAETEEVLKHVIQTILAEGYTGVLLVLDEISLFMKDRDSDQRVDDEKTLVILANRLAKIHNLPVWTICAAQQAIEAKPGLGVKNIIADDRLKLVPLLQNPKDYYDIVLSRVREIKDPDAIHNYYLYYGSHFTWPKSIGEQEFAHFFPFHKLALEVLRDVTHELTTARSAIHFMHQTLKHQIRIKGNELIRLWELFDEAVEYEEDPSGTHAGLVAIKTKRETEYRAYQSCRKQIESLTKGILKVNRDRAIRVIQTLFLYYIARSRQQGLSAEELANAVMIEGRADATPDENIQHYGILGDALKKELPQVVESLDEENTSRYRFEPVVVGIDPNREFQKARDEAESNDDIQRESWFKLLALREWKVKTRLMNINLIGDVKSIFCDITSFPGQNGKIVELNWQNRQIFGLATMRDITRMVAEGQPFSPIVSHQDDLDFCVVVANRPVSEKTLSTAIKKLPDRRILLWTPDELNHDEKTRLLDFAAYQKLISQWGGNDSEDSVAIINWVAGRLQTEIGQIASIVRSSYGRGRFDAINNTQIDFRMVGDLEAVISNPVDRVLSSVYESRDIRFDSPAPFKKEDGIKIINGIIRTGSIPKGVKPNQYISAVQNFGQGLGIVKRNAERVLDVANNKYVDDIWSFIDSKLVDDGQSMAIDTIYRNFMGVGGPKDYGLTRRIVQIYLLCLVRIGKIQITLGTKSGLTIRTLDYSNMESIDFSAKVLDSFERIQKVAKPENWEVLRPYAEKLLNTSIPSTYDDSVIADYRLQLKDLFRKEKDASQHAAERAASLFSFLGVPNPYEKELQQFTRLFNTDIESGNDINSILYGLKKAFEYQAFDTNRPLESEIADLAIRLGNYRNMLALLQYEQELRVGKTYTRLSLPDISTTKIIKRAQQKLNDKISDIQPYIDSHVKLKTELLGSNPPGAGEKDTIEVLIRDYTAMYVALHDRVSDKSDETRRLLDALLQSDELVAFMKLERITALQPAVSDVITNRLKELRKVVFSCSNPSKASIQEQLRSGPVHECGLTLMNAEEYLSAAEKAASNAKEILDRTINDKMTVFLNPAIRDRLEQGRHEPVIHKLLECTSVQEIRSHLISEVLNCESIVDIINRYLKKIVLVPVKIADFQPDLKTVEVHQVSDVGAQFERFLLQALEPAPQEREEDDVIRIIVLE
jgi:hypothetical protein